MNELEKRASEHRRINKKHNRKSLPHAKGAFKPDAGNVSLNVAMFNHMNSPTGGPSNNPVSGPMGGDVSAPSCGMGESLNNSNNSEEKLILSEDVELYYPELTIEVTTREGRPGGYYDSNFGNWLPDDGDTEEINIEYTYDVDYNDVVEFLFADCLTEDDVPGLLTLDDEELNNYVNTHFDELFNKYEDKILDHYLEDAAQHAQEHYE